MAETETIREFLVGLGFKTDEASQKKFANSIATATGKVFLMIQAVEKAAEKVYEFTKDFVNGMEKMYYASQRTGATVENIEAFQFAAEHLGASADEALASLEGMGAFLRNTPGSEGFLHALGISTRKANGDMRDTAEMMIDIGKKTKDMPWFKANLYAGVLGINENTLRALRSGEFEKEFKKHQGMSVGADLQKAAEMSRQLKNWFRDAAAQFDMFAARAEVALLTKLLPALDKFKAWFDSGQLQDAMKSTVDALGNLWDSLDFGDAGAELMDTVKELGKAMVGLGAALKDMFGDAFKSGLQAAIELFRTLLGLASTLLKLLNGDVEGATDSARQAQGGMNRLAYKIVETVQNLGINESNFKGTAGMTAGLIGAPAPNHTSNSASVSQKTDIHVYGTDANSAGQSVANEQNRVNQALVRNLQPRMW